MRRALSILRAGQLMPITPGAWASEPFKRAWELLCDALETLWMDAIRTDEDAQLHSLKLAPKTGDTLTDPALQFFDPADPTDPPVAKVTREGRGTFVSLRSTVSPPTWTIDEAGNGYLALKLNLGDHLEVAGTKVVGARLSAASSTYTAPTSGTTIDTEARASLVLLAADVASIRARLATHGLTS